MWGGVYVCTPAAIVWPRPVGIKAFSTTPRPSPSTPPPGTARAPAAQTGPRPPHLPVPSPVMVHVLRVPLPQPLCSPRRPTVPSGLRVGVPLLCHDQQLNNLSPWPFPLALPQSPLALADMSPGQGPFFSEL